MARSQLPALAASADPFGVVVVASSAGGIKALRCLLAGLPADFPLPIVAVQHLERYRASILDEVLQPVTGLRIRWAQHGARLEPGVVHLAPPNRHVLIAGDELELSGSSPVHYCRPAADKLFRSAAARFGSRTIGVVLTGYGIDANAGVQAIRTRDGYVITQDEPSSQVFEMPRGAADFGLADLVLPIDRIAFTLRVLAGADSRRFGSFEETPIAVG
jgi:two-component system chemotaxis response regulator CheB